jgi:hypothetical protein
MNEFHRLLAEAESVFAASGLSGTNPIIDAAAAEVASATLTNDLDTVRHAVAEFKVAIRTAGAGNRPLRMRNKPRVAA